MRDTDATDAWKKWARPMKDVPVGPGSNMRLKPPPKPIDSAQVGESPRMMIRLRGNVCRELDRFLTHGPLAETGIGQSAFICAAIEILSDPFFQEELIEKGRKWESALPR